MSLHLLSLIPHQPQAVPATLQLPRGYMESYDESYLPTGHEPKNYDLTETYFESLTESMTEQRFPEQRFFEDVD